jgi:riboflavin synthase
MHAWRRPPQLLRQRPIGLQPFVHNPPTRASFHGRLRRFTDLRIDSPMFTRIVEDTGTLLHTEPSPAGKVFTVDTVLDVTDTRIGDSVAVDGVCLTVTSIEPAGARTRFTFDVGPETLRVTTLGELAAGDRVHLERALRVGDRLGGHMVSGHVDGVGRITRAEPQGGALYLDVFVPQDILRLSILKGSITIQGTSLTINAIDDERGVVEVCLIPHTLQQTKLGALTSGARVNLEADLVGKYLERLAAPRR